MSTVKKKIVKASITLKRGGKVKRAQFGKLIKSGLKTIVKNVEKSAVKNVEKSIPKQITKYSSEAEKIAAGYEPNMVGGGKNTAPGKYLSFTQARAKKDLQKAIAERTAREAKAASEKNAKSFINESFSRSTQKNGGKTIKKAQNGVTEKKSLKDKIFGTKEERQDRRLDRQSNREDRQLSREENREDRILRRQCVGGKCGGKARGFIGYKDGGKVMMKRADGSTSQRGLWDNIRAAAKKNKAAGKPGKKPTSVMLKQEKKIKSQTKKK